MKQYAVFKGRASRQEYWMFVLFCAIVSVIASILDFAFDFRYYVGYYSLGYVSSLCQLALLIPGIAVTVRRLHDIGRDGCILILMSACNMFILWLNPFTSSSTLSPDSGAVVIYILSGVASLVLAVWLLVFLCREGDLFTNDYGPSLIEVAPGGSTVKTAFFDPNVPPPLPLNASTQHNNPGFTAVPAAAFSHPASHNSTLAGFIVSFSISEKGESWPLYEGNNPIGSSNENKIILTDRAVSDKHANINVSRGKDDNYWKVQIVDLSSADGTELNGVRLPIFSGQAVANNDRIKIGGYLLQLNIVDKFS